MKTYRVAGCAFEGGIFDDTFKSELSFSDFVDKDVLDLIGYGTPLPEGKTLEQAMDEHDVRIVHVSEGKVIVEGLNRLYTIEALAI